MSLACLVAAAQQRPNERGALDLNGQGRYTAAPAVPGRRGKMRKAVCVPGLLLAAAALASSGCLAVAVGGAAAGGAVGYAYLRGGLSQEFPADLNNTWAATNAALGDLGMPILTAGAKG